MNREEFLRQLERQLAAIPESDRLDAIAYYNDYFDEAGVENEQDVIRELGSPEKVAQTIIEDLKTSDTNAFKDYSAPEEDASYRKQGSYNQQETSSQQTSYDQQASYNQQAGGSNAYQYRQSQDKNDVPWILIIIIAVLTFPIWIGLVASLFGVVMSLFGSGIGLTFGGLGLAIGGIVQLAVGPFEGVIMIGVGAILAAIGVLLLLLFVLLAFQWIPALIRIIIKACRGISHRNEGGNEI